MSPAMRCFTWLVQLMVGKRDSKDTITLATMATCLSYLSFTQANVLEQDAQGYQNWLFSTLANHQLHANIGFEQSFQFWKTSGGGATAINASGGQSGPTYVGWTSPSTSAYVYQAVRTDNGNQNLNYRAVGFARSTGPTWTTSVRVALYRSSVNFPNEPGMPNTCVYPNGLVNLNGSPQLHRPC
jgi:hypothetical protein